jgi:hypothetical protein
MAVCEDTLLAELQLASMVLSYGPKSEESWAHRYALSTIELWHVVFILLMVLGLIVAITTCRNICRLIPQLLKYYKVAVNEVPLISFCIGQGSDQKLDGA